MNFSVHKILAAALILCFSLAAIAQKNSEKEIRDAGKRASQAAEVFREIMDKSDKSIPRELLERAEAIAVFPGVINAAFVFGGRGGEGVISRRTANGWSAPAFFKLGGGSFGAQIGAEKIDVILLIMNDGGLKGLLEDKFEFGGEIGVAAGPLGRTAAATTNATLDAGILSYSRSKGAFIGAALKGGVISPDNDKNRALYGKTSKDVLLANSQIAIPDQVKEFPQTINRFSSRRVNEPPKNEPKRSRTVGSDSEPTNPQAQNDIYYAARVPKRTRGELNGETNEEENVRRTREKLAREIRAELLTLPSYDVFDWLEFQILPDNSVVLRGQVTQSNLKSDAENSLSEIESISSVRNDIEILPVSQEDQNLRLELYREVYTGGLSRYAVGALNPIHIIVKNGGVTLKGLVETESDKNLAAIQANAVNGINGVSNELIVENASR